MFTKIQRWLNLFFVFVLLAGLIAVTPQQVSAAETPEETALGGALYPQTLSAGYATACAVQTDGTLRCWGDDTYDQTTTPEGTFNQVSAGGGHVCAIRSTGELTCWGRNDYGQAVAPEGFFTQVSAGEAHTCALMDGGILTCWGLNTSGQLEFPA